MMDKSNWKAIILNYDTLTLGQPAELRALTPDQIDVLSALAEYTAWRTRWVVPPVDTNAYKAELMYNLLQPIDICALVADCIDDSILVQGALSRYISNNNNGVVDSRFPASANGTNVLSSVACSDNDIYGACVAVVDYINQTCIDIMEIAGLNIDQLFIVARMLDYIVVIGDAPILDDLNDLVTQLINAGINTYNGGYTQQFRQDFICELFCRARLNCDLTAETILESLAFAAGAPISPAATVELIVSALTGGLVGTIFSATLNALVVAALASSGEVGGLVGLQSLQKIAASGNPDGDWSLFCTPCPQTWSYTVDVSNLPPQIKLTDGVYNSFTNRVDALPTGTQSRATLTITVPATTFTRIEVGGFSTASTIPRGAFVRDTGVSPTVLLDRDDTTTTGPRAIDWQGSRSMTQFFCRIDSDNGGVGYMDKIVMHGTGINPF